MTISEDEYLVWRDHPVTQWIFATIERVADAHRDEWMRLSWDDGESDPLKLCELRTRADAYRALIDTPHDRWSQLNDPEA